MGWRGRGVVVAIGWVGCSRTLWLVGGRGWRCGLSIRGAVG